MNTPAPKWFERLGKALTIASLAVCGWLLIVGLAGGWLDLITALVCVGAIALTIREAAG